MLTYPEAVDLRPAQLCRVRLSERDVSPPNPRCRTTGDYFHQRGVYDLFRDFSSFPHAQQVIAGTLRSSCSLYKEPWRVFELF
jgi:hypothetical protein